MTLMYMPHIVVTPYKIFGVYLFAVESVGIDFDNCDVLKLHLGWFCTHFAATNYAEKIRQGGVE